MFRYGIILLTAYYRRLIMQKKIIPKKHIDTAEQIGTYNFIRIC